MIPDLSCVLCMVAEAGNWNKETGEAGNWLSNYREDFMGSLIRTMMGIYGIWWKLLQEKGNAHIDACSTSKPIAPVMRLK